MKKLLPYQLLKNRKKAASAILSKLAHQKTLGKNASLVYAEVAVKLQISGQTVYNYASNGFDKDGYLIDALIEEFKKL